MKNRGFTLIELIMVITVLAIIVIIAVPAVTTTINNSRDNALKTQEKVIINAAKNYFSSVNHSSELTSLNENGTCVTISALQNEGFLPVSDNTSASCSTGLFNPKTKKCISGNSGVKVTYNDGKYNYKYINSCS